jgi:tRNA(Ile)-lysidine synthase
MIFVALLAMDWGLPCTIEVADVETIARQRHLSLEETARQVRYDFLAKVAQQVSATAVAVGHHADDQSETVLMHLLRGTGLAGLRGMLPSVDLESLRGAPNDTSSLSPNAPLRLVRPLLSVSRADVDGYCQSHSLKPRFDRSNLELNHFRNRLRHQLLPLLETYNPNIKALLHQTAKVVAADYELLAIVRDEVWAREVREEGKHRISFDLMGWRALPLALQRATLRQAAYRLRPGLRDLDFVHIQQAVHVATNGSTGAQVILPQGLCLTVGYQTLRLAVADEGPPVPDWPLLWQAEPIPVVLPGQTTLPDKQLHPAQRGPKYDDGGAGSVSRWWLEAGPWNGDTDTVLTNSDRWTAYLDADQLGPRLTLRRRRPGDRFQPLGMGGQKVEVTDLMINAKIPRQWRKQIPLLVHDRPGGNDKEEIAWLVGWRIDERVKITDRTRRMIRLRWLCSPKAQKPDRVV